MKDALGVTGVKVRQEAAGPHRRLSRLGGAGIVPQPRCVGITKTATELQCRHRAAAVEFTIFPKEVLMIEILRSHTLSYVEAFRVALGAEGIPAVVQGRSLTEGDGMPYSVAILHDGDLVTARAILATFEAT